MKIELLHIQKKYNDELLFADINHSFVAPCKVALLGINGSGKSTLLQIISGYLSPSKGKVLYSKNEVTIEPENIFNFVSICAPYLELIEEMTLVEFLEYHFAFKQKLLEIDQMIAYIGLGKSKHKLIEKYSSGMKQRVKLAQAFMSQTPILLLDEPCTNLDEDGFKLFEKMMQDFTSDRIVIIASNDANETKYCTEKYHLNDL